METEKKVEFVQETDSNESMKSIVQDILNESFEDDGTQNSILARLHPSINPVPENSNISILTDHLILTSAASVSPEIIERLNVTCVISAALELPNIPLNHDVGYHKIGIMDSPNSNIFPFFDEAADLIDQVATMGGKTLVFCVAGVSRSASICIAYLMKHHHLTLLQAYNYVKMRRPKIKPNCGFFKQLIEYEKALFITSTVQMVFNEFVQMNIPDVYDSEYKVVRGINKRFRSRFRH